MTNKGNDYVWHRDARSPGKILALVITWGFLIFAISASAAWWLYPPLIFAAAGMTIIVSTTRASGMEITDSVLVFHTPSESRRIQLSGIDRVLVQKWTDAPDVTIVLTNGETLDLPAIARPPTATLTEEFMKRGVIVRVV
ncbi:MAG: hypothetical protein O9315_17475 [Beijerinckiaceae bacterium]|nr:hypothetical protein [Brevundimonas sp.]MCZ8302036.1 hypothetical protein [Beijerinckiaceae bacterium]